MIWPVLLQGSLLYLMKMSRGRCLPGLMAVGRFDDSERGGVPFRETDAASCLYSASTQGPVSKLSSVYARRSMSYVAELQAHSTSPVPPEKPVDVV